MKRVAGLCTLCMLGRALWFSPAMAQTSDKTSAAITAEAWDVTLARGKTRTIEFKTNEGTFYAVDISPDGTWVIFDLLGHVYRVPAKGGNAECLTQDSGAALNYHPRYSPDGASIAFVSDRSGGQDNLWIMGADGRNPRPVYLDRGSRVRQPAWMPDGKAIVAVRVFPSVTNWEVHRTTLAVFPLDGAEPQELISADTWQYFWPAPSPDGEHVYFYRSTTMRQLDNVVEGQHLQRLELATLRVEDITPQKRFPIYTGPDLVETAPEISPDGRRLAFARRIPGGSVDIRGHTYNVRTALWLRDLQSGAERIAMDPIESDATQGNSARHLTAVPGYRWAKDGKSLVVPQGGKIRRVWLDSGHIETIAFTATVRREISVATRSKVSISDAPLSVKFLRWPTTSPDGKQLAFEAVGRLWVTDLPNGKPRPLITRAEPAFQLMPAWSPDGQWIAYITWNDHERGHVWKVPARGGRGQRLTVTAGEYLYPVWDADSRTLLVTRGDGATARGEGWGMIARWDIARMSATGGSASSVGVVDGAVRPSIAAGRIFYPELHNLESITAARQGEFARLQWTVYAASSVKSGVSRAFTIESSGPEPASGGDWMASVAISPRADWVAFVDRFNVYLAPLQTGSGERRVLRRDGPGVRRLSRTGGLYPTWRNPDTVQFVSGNHYFVYDVGSSRMDSTRVPLLLPRPLPSGTIALTGARLVTLDRRRVVDKGSILIRNDRIVCVGDCPLRDADRVIPVDGKTIIPGLVDMHAHHLTGVAGMIPQHRHESARYLAHGVTTVLDPATWPDPAFPIAELIEAGQLLGPRTYSVGNLMYGFGGRSDIKTYEDAIDNVARLISWGAVSIKDYLLPTRVEHQMLTQAARAAGITITAEGEDLFRNLAVIIDGHAGWEHNLPYTPLYADASQFFGQAGVVYSATLNVSSPSLRGQEYYLVRSRLLDDPKQRRFVPWRELASAKYYTVRPLEDYAFPILSEGLADIVRAGGQGAMGGHGEWYGLDSHWDLWSGANALSPMEALEVGTWQSASFIGLDDDIGSISVGKVADLVVLNSNPLDNIKNTRDILYVMKGGRLYDGDTLDEIWPQARPYGSRPWAVDWLPH